MNYLAPLLFAGTLVLLGLLAWAWVSWRDRRDLKRFEQRYRAEITEAAKGVEVDIPYMGKAKIYSPTDSIDSPQP